MKFAIINRVTIPVLIDSESQDDFECLESKKYSIKFGNDAEFVHGIDKNGELIYEFSIKELKELVKTLEDCIEIAEHYNGMRKRGK